MTKARLSSGDSGGDTEPGLPPLEEPAPEPDELLPRGPPCKVELNLPIPVSSAATRCMNVERAPALRGVSVRRSAYQQSVDRYGKDCMIGALEACVIQRVL